MSHLTFIFDLDDTLVYNQYLHYRSEMAWLVYAIQRFYPGNKELCNIVKTVHKQLYKDGFDAKAPLEYLSIYGEETIAPIKEIVDRMSKVDIENVELAKKRGLNAFSSNRYPSSLVATFEFFSEKFNVPHTEEDKRYVFLIGKQTFEVEPAIIGKAREVLKFLKSKRHQIIVYTKGDDEVQTKKLEVNNIKEFFSEVHIVHEKNSAVFRNVVGTKKRDQVYMVGNSFKSDIVPALELNVKAIFIPKDTWKYEEDYSAMRYSKKLMIYMEKIGDMIDDYHKLH